MNVWILVGLFLFLVLQTILLIVWYSLIKRLKYKRKNTKEIATQKYIKQLEKQIDLEYYI